MTCWVTLRTRPAESQRLLEKMADEALAEIQAGLAQPMIFAEDGGNVPG